MSYTVQIGNYIGYLDDKIITIRQLHDGLLQGQVFEVTDDDNESSLLRVAAALHEKIQEK